MTTPEDVFAAVAKEYGITVEELLGASRLRHITEARQMAMYVLFERLGLTVMEVADALSHHHATVIYSVKRIGELIEVDKAVRTHYNAIIKAL